MRGYGFYAVILLIIMAAVYLSEGLSNGSSKNFGQTEFIQSLENDNVKSVEVFPNEEVYTGRIKVELKDGNTYSFYATDIRVQEQQAMDEGITPIVHDIEKPSWFLTSVLPYLLGFVVIILMFSFLTSQMSGGGGGNSKVMNFGKSRAKMTTDEHNKTTFKNVAGLQEEKEELKEIVDFLKAPKNTFKLGLEFQREFYLRDLLELVKH